MEIDLDLICPIMDILIEIMVVLRDVLKMLTISNFFLMLQVVADVMDLIVFVLLNHRRDRRPRHHHRLHHL